MRRGKGLLTPLQKAFLAAFSQLPDQARFYLTGGTALAEFYLGHRLSFDLDFFTSEAGIILPVSYQVEAIGPSHGFQVKATRRFASFVEFLIETDEERLRVDLALDSPFRFKPPVRTEWGIYVNDATDLYVDKLLAYYGRAEPRDSMDLYFILRRKPVSPLLALAAQKDSGFDLYWFAVALQRAAELPDEVDRWPVKVLVPFDPLRLKRRFLKLAMDLMSQTVNRSR